MFIVDKSTDNLKYLLKCYMMEISMEYLNNKPRLWNINFTISFFWTSTSCLN